MQPGTGINVANSGRGLTLDVQATWPDEFGVDGPQFAVELCPPHPFRIVKNYAEIVPGLFINLIPDAGDTYEVLPGTVNGTAVSPLGPTSCGEAIQNVYLQTYPTASAQIVVSTSVLPDTDTEAYLLIGTVNKYNKTQFVKSNILCERYVLGQLPAVYHHSHADFL